LSIRNHLQTNFSTGQVDSRLRGRLDTTLYANGALNLLNNSPLVGGGVRRRPGTRYLQTLNGHSRLERLQFNDSQLYIFAFGVGRLDVYSQLGVLHTSLTGQPWTAVTMWEMAIAQQGDTTIIAHQDFIMKKLVRTGATSFTITDWTFETHSSGYPVYEPYYKFASNEITLAASATSGSINLTVSSAYWTADHVGSLVRYKGKTCTVTAFTSTTVVVATVNETLAATAADTEWDENVFSAKNGYARSTTFHGRRLWFGGSKELSRHAFSSKSGAFFNFDVGTGLDDESIQAEVGVNDIGDIHHSHSGRHLLFLSDTGVVYIPETDTSPVTPSTFNPRFQVPYGARATVVPKRLDGADIYIQDTGKVARELIYSDAQQAYTGEAISLVSNELIADVQQLTVLYGHADGPEQFAIAVNADGTLAVYHTIRSQSIAGWYPWTTTGSFESVTNLNNEVFTSVKRNINGSDVYYLEKFDFNLSVDCAISISGASTATFTAAHLASEDVYGITDTRATSLGQVTANGSGVCVFSEAVENIDVGFDYSRTIATLPPTIQTSQGPMSGELKRIGEVVLEVFESVSFSVNGYDFLIRQVNDDLSLSPTKSTERHRFNLLGWSREGTITITQDEPLDFTLLSIWMEVWT
tara:strand:+ start:6182 stop:8098 length:1917 start_codon:yes stop_codon:yes gene_type:complete